MKQMMKFAFLGVLLGFSGMAAAAPKVPSQLASIDTRFRHCIKHDSSTAGMKECTSRAYKDADALLNSVYLSIRNSLNGTSSRSSYSQEQLKRLLASERAWVPYRDAECDMQGLQMLGGSGEGLIVISCLYDLTGKRIKNLNNLFNTSAD